MMFDTQRIKTAFEKVRKELLARRIDGHWVGRLSSSPLSTATAVSALSLYQHNSASGGRCFPLLEKSVNYLLQTQNADGGWGDTDKSFSNISTTLLVKSSLTLYQQSFHFSADDFNQRGTLRRADAYIAANGGIAAIKQRYGKDNTFSVPILTNAALAGLADWKDVPQLPFERAVMPQWMFRLLNLQVVSYAIPALVAIGQVRFYQTLLTKGACPLISIKRFPLTLRKLAIKPTLKLIARMQPGSGGYLEAAPLTSFVAMSLLRAGNTVSRLQSEIIENCIKFLLDTVREDGSWAIDTNLAAWATTLSVNALGKESFNEKESEQLAEWILSCQHTKRHPFTGAEPGGWGWTNLSGAVPDADDTPGAILALIELLPNIHNETLKTKIVRAAQSGICWLRKLQNSDGGIPTFCRGWGVLPFDKSSTDLTAHTIRALLTAELIPLKLMTGLFRFLQKTQNTDGSWHPLWFGNQHQPDDINPFYGTARVLLALHNERGTMFTKGLQFLVNSQNAGGSWGNSIEETAVVVEALVQISRQGLAPDNNEALQRGLEYLLTAVENDTYKEPSPIGLYFAKLWYYEELYPLIFTAAALRKCLQKKMKN